VKNEYPIVLSNSIINTPMKTFKQYTEDSTTSKIDRKKLLDFFMANNDIKSSDVHKLSDEMGVSSSDLEDEIYKMLSTFTHGGFAKEKNITEKDVNPKELQMGIKVEMEHLNDKSPYATHLAKRISLDHLAELPDYYSKLKEVEA